MTTLKEKIANEMISDYSNALERNFELAKRFIRVTNDGKVEIIYKESFSGEELIQLYCIGKQYAFEAGLSKSKGVDNNELKDELGKSIGSILPWLKTLRDKRKIVQDNSKSLSEHFISTNLIEPTLNALNKKYNKTS